MWAVYVTRGVLGTSRVSEYFDAEQGAKDDLAQFGPFDGYVAGRKYVDSSNQMFWSEAMERMNDA